MGLRGPLRDPNSRRGKAEIARRQRLTDKDACKVADSTVAECVPDPGNPELPTAPKCFSRAQANLFASLVSDLVAARVPLQRVDAHAVAMAVRCISAIEGAGQKIRARGHGLG
jgi:hypothetical protein